MRSALLVMGVCACSAVHAHETRILVKEVVVRAPLATVWNAWTTTEGLKFVSRKSNVELTIGGP